MRSLADLEFPDRVAAALDRHRVPPELLTLELTESGVMADPQRALPVLRALHNHGVVLAVDDFGTGYSSLAYLRQLPVDEVKIDKSFVFGMGSDLGDLAVVRSIVELGHSLGLVVVAEGVEEDAARDQLAAHGLRRRAGVPDLPPAVRGAPRGLAAGTHGDRPRTCVTRRSSRCFREWYPDFAGLRAPCTVITAHAERARPNSSVGRASPW